MEPAEGAPDAVPLDVSLHDVRRQLGVAGTNGRQHVAAHVLLYLIVYKRTIIIQLNVQSEAI
jgi:hypothetical protein